MCNQSVRKKQKGWVVYYIDQWHFLLIGDLDRNWTLQCYPVVRTACKPKVGLTKGCRFLVMASNNYWLFLESPKNWSFKIVANLCLLYFFRNIICEKLNFPTEKWINKQPCVSGFHMLSSVSIHIVNGNQLKKLLYQINKQTKPKTYK
jgi:hypothetical protein